MKAQYPWLNNTFPVIVDMISSSQSSLFLSQRFHTLKLSEGLIPYFNDGSEVFITRDLYTQDQYAFSSQMFSSNREELGPITKVLGEVNDPYFDKIYATYTLLPSHLEEELYKLAQDITAPFETPFEKALALENHLKKYYAYTLTPEPIGENQDFVTYLIHV